MISMLFRHAPQVSIQMVSLYQLAHSLCVEGIWQAGSV